MVVKLRFFSIVIFLFSIILLKNYAEDSFSYIGEQNGKIEIKWKAENASLYRVEIKRDGVVFISTETTDNFLKINLAPGKYEYRIHTLNVFGKISSSSEWFPLIVKKTLTPFFRVENKISITRDRLPADITAVSPFFEENTEFYLSNGTERYKPEWRKDGNRALLTINREIKEGVWNITAVNPSGREFTVPEVLTVKSAEVPEINISTPVPLHTGKISQFTIKGSNFSPEMKVVIKNGKDEIPVESIIVKNENEAVVFANLEKAGKGTYDIIITNPGGKSAIADSALTVSKNKKIYQPRKTSFEIQLGYAPFIIIAPDNLLVPSYINMEAALTFQNNSEKKFWRALGIEINGSAGITGPLYMEENGSSDIYVDFVGTAGISGYWRPELKSNLVPVILIGIGNMWSDFAARFNLPNMYYFKTGIAVDSGKGDNFFRFGLNLLIGYTGDGGIPIFSLTLRRGLSF